MAYDIVPSVDENYQFPPEITQALGVDDTFIGKLIYNSRMEARFAKQSATPLSDEDLDTVKTPGTYTQTNLPGGMTSVLHYPTGAVGLLLVWSNPGGAYTFQQYTTPTSSGDRMFRRSHNQKWGDWVEILKPSDVDAKIASNSFIKNVIANGTDINTLRTPGVYTVASTAVAGTLINYPTNRAGSIEVLTADGASVTTQIVTAMVSTTQPTEVYTRATISSANTSWGPWSSPEWSKGVIKGTVEAPVDIDKFRTNGMWFVTSRTGVNNLPGSAKGILEVLMNPATGMAVQRFTEVITNEDIKVWQRGTGLVTGWIGIPWTQTGGKMTAPSAGVSSVQTSDHASRVEIAASRRGGGIGTGGKPVFMWRFDHWLVDFRDKILPILREFDLPATLNVNYDNMSNVQNGGGSISWTDVQAWNQRYGIEIANHGSTHTNADNMSSIFHEVVDGRRNLEKSMPRVAIETWQEHGSAYLVATDLPGDTGLDLGRSVEAFTESYAGKLVLAEHAIVEGKTGSFYPPLNGKPQIGQSHYSMDRLFAPEAIDVIKYAQKVGRGLTGYTHPGLMDKVNIGGSTYPVTYNSDGSVDFEGTHYNTETEFRDAQSAAGNIVHMPVKEFRKICEWLAAERAQGRIMVMTAAGGGFADKSHDRRENLFVSPGFEDTSDWSSLNGWVVSNPGKDVVLKSSSGTTPFTQGMLLFTRFGWAMGATHEILINARAEASTNLTIEIEELNNASNWSAGNTYRVSGDGIIRPYRLNFTLPRDRSISTLTVRIGGESLEIHGAPIFAAI